MASLPDLAVGLIFGAGAQGRVVAAVWRRMEHSRPLAFIDDDPKLRGVVIDGLAVLASTAELLGQSAARWQGIVAVGKNIVRLKIAERIAPRCEFINVIDPSAVIMPNTRLGGGVLVGPQAVVHTGAVVGDQCIINTGAIVEHDCVLEAGVTISPGVRMAGRVYIERSAFLATGVSVAGRVRIHTGSIVGAGGVVVRDIPANSLAFGVPARVIREVRESDWDRLF